MRRLAMFALVSTLAACSMDSTGPNGSVAGTYTLQRINGQTLPYTFSSGLRLTSDELTLMSDGTYQDVSRYSDGTSFVDDGDYSEYNGAITFYSSTGETIQGSVSGNVLTQVLNNYTQVFQRN
ncbi:MAG: hypothetical protein DMD35_13485 [Gemmatimonadetes bacterium]|nr:MAG: hypothetical protein DMD35_13485 [Gemmatimonadota bacterium]